MSSIRLLFLLPLSISFLSIHPAISAVIDVPPGPAEAVSKAVATAKPGDIVQLHAGVYSGTVTIRTSGSPENPIIISGEPWKQGGAEPKVMIDGGGTPVKGKANQAFHLIGANWIVIQDIGIRNAWTDAIAVENSSYISVQRCSIRGGQSAILTRGDGTHHVLIEHCNWSQDERVYTEWDWATMHHGSLVAYNGGLYGGNGAGGAVIRFNAVQDVFNGLRYWMTDELAEKRRNQSNIEIYDNAFKHCRDNVIEPEVFAWNLHIYHNRLDSCPRGVFSIDGILGGWIYVYGNTGYWTRDGGFESDAWTIYKFQNYGKKPSLEQPLLIDHNSFSYTSSFVRGSKERKAQDHVLHFNNAYFHQGSKSHFGLVEWPGHDCEFDYDISSRPWATDVTRLGYEAHGIENSDPGFRAPAENDFRVKEGSAAVDHGKVLDGLTLWYRGAAPDMGAFEGDWSVYLTPFLHRDPPGGALYKEKPRVVRIFARGKQLALFFSAPLETKTLTKETVGISVEDKTIPVKTVTFPTEAHVAVLSLDAPLAESVKEIELRFTSMPKGANGETATLWAADLRVVRIPEEGTLVGVAKAAFK